mmetsp:Transcript_16415/g.45439  ORF Transcript_16415/g.45439 Transcript_16415/m.45439 type:complete len:300 (+) Transcript_16415:599-1498(+)
MGALRHHIRQVLRPDLQAGHPRDDALQAPLRLANRGLGAAAHGGHERQVGDHLVLLAGPMQGLLLAPPLGLLGPRLLALHLLQHTAKVVDHGVDALRLDGGIPVKHVLDLHQDRVGVRLVFDRRLDLQLEAGGLEGRGRGLRGRLHLVNILVLRCHLNERREAVLGVVGGALLAVGGRVSKVPATEQIHQFAQRPVLVVPGMPNGLHDGGLLADALVYLRPELAIDLDDGLGKAGTELELLRLLLALRQHALIGSLERRCGARLEKHLLLLLQALRELLPDGRQGRLGARAQRRREVDL